MKQEELLQQYNTLKTALDNSEITEKYFQESVNHLRYEDAQGVWHQIDAETGDWLYWEDFGLVGFDGVFGFEIVEKAI